MNKYDVVIKSAAKDYFKLPLVVDSIQFLNPQPSKIYILSQNGYLPKGTDYESKLVAVKDSEITPFINRKKLTHRPNWNWINLVSLFQNFTEQDFYFDIQSDNFFLNPIDLFTEDGKPRIFRSTVNHVNVSGWPPYFNFSERVFDIPKMSNGFSYIIEFLMYNKNLTKKLIEPYSSFEEMMEVVYSNVNQNSYPADQEIFGNLLEKHFPTEYSFVDNFPVYFTGTESLDIGLDQIQKYILDVRTQLPNVVSCSFHSWE